MQLILERSDSLPKVIEVEQGVNPSSAQSDPSSRKYREYQSVTYPDDPALIAVSNAGSVPCLHFVPCLFFYGMSYLFIFLFVEKLIL